MSNKQIQMSESYVVYLILAVSGGCMDAYSYLCRDKVFANAQTGNMLLLGVNLAEKNYANVFRYFWPVFAFAAGIILADVIRKMNKEVHFHWRQVSLGVEILLLFSVGWIPSSHNFLANILTSFACGIQVESFRSTGGNSITTTMCIGNLRSGTNNLDQYFQTHDKKYLHRSLIYFGIILFFVIGAVIESILIKHFSRKAIFLSVAMLILSFLLMNFKPQENKMIF